LILTIDRKLTPAELAEAFCELNDEAQAQVFIEIARIAATWPPGNFMQWHAVGRHLRDCECSTPEAVDLVREIAEATSPSLANAP
jgi:hypothetical protein